MPGSGTTKQGEEEEGSNPRLSLYLLSDLFRDPLKMPEAQASHPHSLGLETENFSVYPFIPSH